MHSVTKILLGAVALAGVAAAAYAQGAAPTRTMAEASVNDPAGPLPDPTHIEITKLGTDWDKMKWEGDPAREQHIQLFGDRTKPGLYGQLLRWMPGNSSRPHKHNQDRDIYVLSGTWWVGGSAKFEPKLTYPIHAGTFVRHPANTVHWDGARAGGPPAVLYLVGMGPVTTTSVDENGNPRPRPAE